MGRGVGLHDPDFITYRRQLVARGKPPLVALIAVGHRAHRLAFAMLRSQRPFDSDRWEADQILSQVDPGSRSVKAALAASTGRCVATR